MVRDDSKLLGDSDGVPISKWSEMTLNFWVIVKGYPFPKVQDDPKLLGDNGEVPISEWSGWGSILAVKSSLYLT